MLVLQRKHFSLLRVKEYFQIDLNFEKIVRKVKEMGHGVSFM
jgi:hypothetical protein